MIPEFMCNNLLRVCRCLQALVDKLTRTFQEAKKHEFPRQQASSTSVSQRVGIGHVASMLDDELDIGPALDTHAG